MITFLRRLDVSGGNVINEKNKVNKFVPDIEFVRHCGICST